MQLRRIVIALEEAQRVILYPQGGLEIETLVRGVGWVLDLSEAYYPELGNLLDHAALLVLNQAQDEAHEDEMADVPW